MEASQCLSRFMTSHEYVSAAGLEGYSAVVEQLSQYATSQSSANLLNNEATRYLTGQLNQGFASVGNHSGHCPHASCMLICSLLSCASFSKQGLTADAIARFRMPSFLTCFIQTLCT